MLHIPLHSAATPEAAPAASFGISKACLNRYAQLLRGREFTPLGNADSGGCPDLWSWCGNNVENINNSGQAVSLHF